MIKIRERFTFNISFIDVINILTVGEIPSHDHEASTTTDGEHSHSIGTADTSGEHLDLSPNTGDTLYDIRSGYITRVTANAGNHKHIVTINNTGGNQPHNNMQPYLAVYMWKRTA